MNERPNEHSPPQQAEEASIPAQEPHRFPSGRTSEDIGREAAAIVGECAEAGAPGIPEGLRPFFRRPTDIN